MFSSVELSESGNCRGCVDFSTLEELKPKGYENACKGNPNPFSSVELAQVFVSV